MVIASVSLRDLHHAMRSLTLAQISKKIIKGIVIRMTAGFLHLGRCGIGSGDLGLAFLGWFWL
jgi:hypothetical protein